MGVALTGSPIITALRKLVTKKLETLPTLVFAPLHWKVPRFILKDAQQYCSYSDNAQSNIKVMRKMEMKPGLFNKFSSPVPREMYREQYGEYAC